MKVTLEIRVKNSDTDSIVEYCYFPRCHLEFAAQTLDQIAEQLRSLSREIQNARELQHKE